MEPEHGTRRVRSHLATAQRVSVWPRVSGGRQRGPSDVHAAADPIDPPYATTMGHSVTGSAGPWTRSQPPLRSPGVIFRSPRPGEARCSRTTSEISAGTPQIPVGTPQRATLRRPQCARRAGFGQGRERAPRSTRFVLQSPPPPRCRTPVPDRRPQPTPRQRATPPRCEGASPRDTSLSAERPAAGVQQARAKDQRSSL